MGAALVVLAVQPACAEIAVAADFPISSHAQRTEEKADVTVRLLEAYRRDVQGEDKSSRDSASRIRPPASVFSSEN